MKIRLFLLFICMVSSFEFVNAQSPQKINYQGIARNNSGNPITSQNIALRMTIRSGAPTGMVEYQETHSVTTTNLGLFSLKIGDGNVTSGSFSNIPWSSNSHYLEVELDVNGGTAFTTMGVSQLVSVPYALHATTVEFDQTQDDDADSLNEIQSLFLNTDTLGLSNGGGSIILPNDSDWVTSGNDLYNGNLGNVGVGVSNPQAKLSVKNSFQVLDSTNAVSIGIYSGGSSQNGMIEAFGINGNRNAYLGFNPSNPYFGYFSVNDINGAPAAGMSINSNVLVGNYWTNGPNGLVNTYATSWTGFPNNGYLYVCDAAGVNQSGMFVNSSGQGVIYAAIKSFRMKHPEMPDKEIWYASLEGPEAGAYARGTSTLINGQAEVTFPDHFVLVANESTLTATLTPLDADSKGLAVVKKMANGFQVKELFNGSGNYDFDWEVKAVRKGFETFEVVRDKIEN